ncbi:sulfite exporter TauE/SafE family protein [Klugiella xanthotipulae]|uniref:Probable membrane transporter protein n=1 Tax=Klugiella xanthotipulae TaxID=244735 RepID=A0A543I607_9MICO|nr:sulfite exporter TauE/SafE family protein [Klugiella xanthotipulae]TQM66009.1 hypothetical protein FB466_0830 [Klugiella xanthotipulae]
MTTTAPTAHTGWLIKLIVIGVVGGFLSGLFGVGGGVVIVPALVLALGFEQRMAAGTSLAAIVPTVTVGVISYAVNGEVNWIAALLLAVGMVVGAQLGSYLLARISQRYLQWGFILFQVFVIIQMFMIVPSRDGVFTMAGWGVAGLIALGCATGILSGLLGVGGGIIVVPVLIVFFGASDLVAKGTSLLMMIPGSLSGTIGNLRRGNVDLKAAAVVGLSACTVTWVGAIVAGALTPLASNILFACFLVVVVARMLLQRLRADRAARVRPQL